MRTYLSPGHPGEPVGPPCVVTVMSVVDATKLLAFLHAAVDLCPNYIPHLGNSPAEALAPLVASLKAGLGDQR